MQRWLRFIQQTQFNQHGSNARVFRWLLVALGCTFATGIVVTFTHGETVTPTVDKTVPDQRFVPKKQAFFPAPQLPDESTTETTPSKNGHASPASPRQSPPPPKSPPQPTSGSTTDAPAPPEETNPAPPPSTSPNRSTQPDPGAAAKPESDPQPSSSPAAASPAQPASNTPSDPSPASTNASGTSQSDPTGDGSTKTSNDQVDNADDPSSEATDRASNQEGQGGGTGGSKEAADDLGLGLTPSTTTEPIRFDNCDDAYDAGVAPILAGEPGYERRLDADADGIACDIDLRV